MALKEFLMHSQYVSQAGLVYMKNEYKYESVSNSILDKHFDPVWTALVEYCPRWVAPNAITCTGFALICLSFFLNLWYCPSLRGDIPTWVFLVHTFCLLIYQLLDAIDGKQARRTGTQSPLGELFDHGVDSVVLVLLGFVGLSTLQLGPGWLSFFMAVLSYLAFFTAQWGEYHSGKLELGKLSVTELQCLFMVHYLFTAIVGSHFWATQIQFPFFTIQPNMIFGLFHIMCAIGTIVYGIHNFNKEAQRRVMSSDAYFRLFPAIATAISATVWAYFSPSEILFNNPYIFGLAIGFTFSNLVVKLVLFRVCSEPFAWIQLVTLPVIVAAINSLYSTAILDFFAALLVCMFEILFFIHFSVSSINVVKDFLNISVFKVKQDQKHQ